LFQFYLGRPVPVYCEPQVEERIRHSFDYAFRGEAATHKGAVPQLELRPLDLNPLQVLGARVTPIRLKHGPRFQVLGFRIGDVAYCTDTNHVPPESMRLLEGLDVLILDALRPRPHVTHFGLDEAIEVAGRLGARQTYFTHVSHELDFERTNAMLPRGMALAYDGLRIPLR
jgi:phosphoribosyl 1,2-cyclic phosphate phosphodiesterase